MRKRLTGILLIILVLAAFSNVAVAQDQTTLLWGMWGSPEEIAVHQKVADAYMEANPNVTVELWSQPWGDYFTKMDTLFAAGDGTAIPDVFFMSPIQRYAASGLIQSLDPFIEEAGLDREDYWPGALESTSLDGVVYGFPRDSAVETLYYNKDDFDAAGLEYPTDEWTWDDLRAAAEALTIKDDTGRVTRYGLAAEGGKYFNFVGANGGAILDDMFAPGECRLSTPESIAGVEFFAGLMNDEIAWRDANLGQAGGDQAVFLSGQASMFIQNASRVPALNAAGVNYDVAAVPLAPSGGRQAGSTNGAAWVMSALSDQPEDAWAFLQFLQSPEGGQAVYFSAGDAFPPTKSGANSPVFLDDSRAPANKQAWLVGAESAPPNGNGWFPEWGELNSTIISPVLTSIWAGEAQAADVLPGLCDSVNTFLTDKGYPK
ncbi:MAG: sugar ABC transporter substrate-binding protein [Chloroflexi bacterium]|nr:sugar ABC transporter substrate-binding protein [Chloroflexota bacterium]MCC6895694.1 sugar ABC transporter substrate-binding protein [Anaerolineae bacterium]